MANPLIYRTFFVVFFGFISPMFSFAQSLDALQYQPFENLKAWSVLLSDWQQPKPKVHVINTSLIKGHGTAAQKILGRSLTFAAFKAMVNQPVKRQFLPLNLFDLRAQKIRYEGKHLAKAKIDFAIQVIDYQYQDTPNQMTETAIKTVKIIEKWLKEHQMSGNVALVLADNKANKLNTDLAQTLAQNNIYTLRLNDLRSAKSPVEVLNAAEAVGYLRYIKAGTEADYRLNSHDIAIYERLPDRVPIVAGIITLEPQTPLSHTALLAKNRGTLNMYIGQWDKATDLQKRIGQLVKITADTKHSYRIDVVSKTQAEAIWRKNTRKVDIITPELSLTEVVDFRNQHTIEEQTASIGAKAANYALLQHDFPKYVRKGFAIPFSFYTQTIQQSDAARLIERFLIEKDTMNVVERENRLKKIRKSIKKTTIPRDFYAKIHELLNKEFAGKKVRLRSSTNCEDLPDFNGAGLYESKGFYTHLPTDSLARKILGVYASLWSDAAFEEREFFGISHHKAAMAILIHEAFSDEMANGVALTSPTATSHTIVINLQKGDNLVTNPKGQPYVLQLESADVKQPLTPKNKVPNTEQWALDYCRNQSKMRELQILIDKIHRRLTSSTAMAKYGVDVEFRLMQGSTDEPIIFIKQARLLR